MAGCNCQSSGNLQSNFISFSASHGLNVTKPEVFDISCSKDIALELESINKIMKTENRKYLLVGFGRWGSSDEWLGIPVEWAQISNAKVIIEAMLPNFNVELSQGSHFSHA